MTHRRLARGYNVSEVPLAPVPAIKEGTIIQETTTNPTHRAVGRAIAAVGLGCELPYYMPHASDRDTPGLMKGVMKRAAFKPPTPKPEMKAKFIYFIKNVFVKQFKQMEAPKFEWLSPEAIMEYLESTNYPQHRKQGLYEEYEELIASNPFDPKHAVVKGFMKDEPYTEIKYPRLINPRSDKFKVIAAPVFKKIEVEIYKHPSFLKGVPREQWADKVCDKFVPGYATQSNDFSSYEAHAVEWVQECEFVIYEHILGPYAPYFWSWMKKMFLGRQHLVYKYFTVS
jgi:hypothetical protein